MALYKFTLDVENFVSGKLTNMIGVVQQTAGKVTELQNKLQSFSKFSGSSIDGLNTKLSKLYNQRNAQTSIQGIRRLNTEIRQTERQLSRLENLPPLSFIERIRGASGGFMGIAKHAIGAFGAISVFEGVKGIVTLGSDLEMTNVAFTTMLGSADAAKKMVGDLNEYANITPFSNADMYDSAKMLLNFGVANEKVMPSLKMLGDIAMGDKNKLSQLTLAFSQVQSTGRLMGQDLLQLINAGFNPLQELSKMTGKSMATLQDEMSKGQISADMVSEAFKNVTSEGGRFYNMAQKMSKTGQGLFSTLMGTLQFKASELGLSLVEKLKPVLDFAIRLVDNLKPVGDAFNNVWQAVQPLLTGLWDLLGSFFSISKSGDSAKGTMDRLALILNILSFPIELVANGIGAIFEAVSFLMPVLKPLIYAYALWTAVQWALNFAMTANPVGIIIAGIVLLVGAVVWVVKMIIKHWDTLTAWFTSMVTFWAKYLNPFGWLLQLVEFVFPDAYKKIMGWINKIIGGVKKAIDWIGGLFKSKDTEVKVKVDDQTGVVDVTKTNQISTQTDLTGGLLPSTPNALDNIAGGGAKQTNIEITIQKMIETFNVKPGEGQSWKDIEDKVIETMLRVVNSANRMNTAQ